jgi:hypothetical protein
MPGEAAHYSRVHLRNPPRDASMANPHPSASADVTKQSIKDCFSQKRHDESHNSNLGCNTSYSQLDGLGDYYSHTQLKNVKTNFMQPSHPRAQPHQQRQGLPQQPLPHATSQLRPRQQSHLPESAVKDIVPYCTTEPPLRQEQVIALSDIAGSVKELVLLALRAAAGDAGCAERMEGAVGSETTGSVVEFFAEEWEVE